MLSATDGKWKIAGLIDFAGVEVGPREFEWGDLWLDLFAQNSEAMRIFMSAYDPTIKIDAEFCRKGFLLFLLCSGYGSLGAAVGPIDLTEWIRRYPDGVSQSSINSLQPFQESLWPSSLWQDN